MGKIFDILTGFLDYVCEYVLCLFYPSLEDSTEVEIPPKVDHKKYDTTRFTQAHYDFIMICYREFLAYNAARPHKDRKTQQDLANVLNEKTGLDKSTTAYARIWRGKVDRDSLAPGKETYTI